MVEEASLNVGTDVNIIEDALAVSNARITSNTCLSLISFAIFGKNFLAIILLGHLNPAISSKIDPLARQEGRVKLILTYCVLEYKECYNLGAFST
jgi:hypothetical protein